MAQILIVEDERIVKNLLTAILRRKYTVRQASNADEADRICQDAHFEVVIADVNLSESRSGTDFAVRLIRRQPKIRVLFISGLPVENWEEKDVENLGRIPVGSFGSAQASLGGSSVGCN